MADHSIAEPHGARDLVALWRNLPVNIVRYRMPTLPAELALSSLADHLRSRAWRERCLPGKEKACADAKENCPFVDSDRCRADQLFPMYLGGGAPNWRMATLFVQWLRQAEELRLIAIGEAACAELAWAASCLGERFRLPVAQSSPVRTFADVMLAGAGNWRMEFITPWLAAKNTARRTPTHAFILEQLINSMRVRAHKFTALCAHEAIWQRLGAHLAHHIGNALPAMLRIEQASIEPEPPRRYASKGNGGHFEGLALVGEVVLRVAPPALPWLSLLALCGGGENADKGFGVVEITAEQ